MTIYLGDGGPNSFSGGRSSDEFSGLAGSDTLVAGRGNDTLDGGSGGDFLDGGPGDDHYILDDRDDIVIDESGTDSAFVTASFIKVPSTIESVQYAAGIARLPYWIDALLADESAGRYPAQLLGQPGVIFYCFPKTVPDYLLGTEPATGFRGFSDIQIARTKEVLAQLSACVGLEFVETSFVKGANVIAFALNQQVDSGGYAFFPSPDASGSDVFINDDAYSQTFSRGTFGLYTLVHELGHALGLKHPFAEQNAHDESIPPYLPSAEDVTSWTMMSYEYSQADFKPTFSSLDLAALQYLYGPSATARTGDDAYVVSARESLFVWDGAGIDTLDATNVNQPVTLYLTPGYWGYVGSAAAAHITDPGQVTVNFGSVIENLKGSAFADHLFGSELTNVINGQSGDDTIAGGLGNDSIDGGMGTDTVVLSDTHLQYAVSSRSSDGVTTLRHRITGDTVLVSAVEWLKFSDVTLAVERADNSAPVLVSVTPSAAAKQVSVDTVLNFVFDEPIRLGQGSLALKTKSGKVVELVNAGSVDQIKIQENTLTIAFAKPLASATAYSVGMEAGFVTDTLSNAVGQPYNLFFSTNAVPFGRNAAITLMEDQSRVITAQDFGFRDADKGDQLASVVITGVVGKGQFLLGAESLGVGSTVSQQALGSGQLTFSPAPDDAGSQYATLRFRVSDGIDRSATDYALQFRVQPVNDAPVLKLPIPDQSATEGTKFLYALPAQTFTDVDLGDRLSYRASLSDGRALPKWLSFDQKTLSFRGTPGDIDSRTEIALMVKATDQSGKSVSDVFALQVIDVNQSPVAKKVAFSAKATAGKEFSFSPPKGTFYDPDRGDVLSFTLAEAPTWTRVEAQTGRVYGTPGVDLVEHGGGTESVVLAASDAGGLSARVTLNIQVTPDPDSMGVPVVGMPMGVLGGDGLG